MIKKVKCYNYERLLTMLAIQKNSTKHDEFLKMITSYNLKEIFVANSQYRQCEITDEVQVNESGKLGTTIGLFTFF